MTGMNGWDPERLGRLTLAQFQCLMDKQPPGELPVLESVADFESALAQIRDQERQWYAR